MKKTVALIFSIFLLTGCATMANLEYRVDVLEEKCANNYVEVNFTEIYERIRALEISVYPPRPCTGCPPYAP